MFRRYDAPVIVLDLVKQWERRPRESIVGREFRHAVEELNFSMPLEMQIRYYALDYTRASKSKGQGLAQGQGLGGGSQWPAPAAAQAENTDRTGPRASSGVGRGVGWAGTVDHDGEAGGGFVAGADGGGFGQGVGPRARRSNRMGDVGPEWATLER